MARGINNYEKGRGQHKEIIARQMVGLASVMECDERLHAHDFCDGKTTTYGLGFILDDVHTLGAQAQVVAHDLDIAHREIKDREIKLCYVEQERDKKIEELLGVISDLRGRVERRNYGEEDAAGNQ